MVGVQVEVAFDRVLPVVEGCQEWDGPDSRRFQKANLLLVRFWYKGEAALARPLNRAEEEGLSRFIGPR